MDHIAITVDKSHLITIGEQLYARSIELIRELINNAYDADAAQVHVEIGEKNITVRDDGTGMDLEGLRQYFNIGSREKRIRSRSEKFQRERIGQFGIGKFASLSACSRFVVETKRGDFAARVIFDKEEWERNADHWDLPLEILSPVPARDDGTTVVLENLSRTFDLTEVEKTIIESVPIQAPDFEVFLNGNRVTPRKYSGHRIPFLEGTRFGVIHGEVVILPVSQSHDRDFGIECKVRNVTVRREFFGMESWGKEIARVRGEVHADFLPVTSDRSGFRVDSEEYREFYAVMEKVVSDIRKVLNSLSGRKENQRVKRALREALDRIQQALTRNPEFSPFGVLPEGSDTGPLGEAGAVRKGREDGKGETETPKKRERKEKKPRPVIPSVKRLTPDAVVQKVRMNHVGVTCCLDQFGPDGPECFTEGTIIYINRDHPLYRREAHSLKTHTMHIARLITQEIALMKDPADPRQAFERQSRLLKDAFISG